MSKLKLMLDAHGFDARLWKALILDIQEEHESRLNALGEGKSGKTYDYWVGYLTALKLILQITEDVVKKESQL